MSWVQVLFVNDVLFICTWATALKWRSERVGSLHDCLCRPRYRSFMYYVYVSCRWFLHLAVTSMFLASWFTDWKMLY